MDYVLLVAIVIMLSAQHVFASLYNRRTNKAGSYLGTLIIAVTVMIFFACYSKFDLTYNTITMIYGFAFGCFYLMGFLFEIKAMGVGSVSLTTLILSFSLILPTLFGIIYFKDAINHRTFWVALALLCVALFLVNYVPQNKEEKNTSDKKTRIKWFIYLAFAFLGNGLCTITQSLQQRATGGLYKSEFMMFAMAIVIISTLILTLISEKKNHDTLPSLKKGWWAALIMGIFNASVNLLVMMVVSGNNISLGIFYPLISGGTLIITFILARIIFKEKLRPLQLIGFVAGIASVVLFNI